jgi:hypothetical protein
MTKVYQIDRNPRNYRRVIVDETGAVYRDVGDRDGEYIGTSIRAYPGARRERPEIERRVLEMFAKPW